MPPNIAGLPLATAIRRLTARLNEDMSMEEAAKLRMLAQAARDLAVAARIDIESRANSRSVAIPLSFKETPEEIRARLLSVSTESNDIEPATVPEEMDR
jgi:hypothetical protein